MPKGDQNVSTPFQEGSQHFTLSRGGGGDSKTLFTRNYAVFSPSLPIMNGWSLISLWEQESDSGCFCVCCFYTASLITMTPNDVLFLSSPMLWFIIPTALVGSNSYCQPLDPIDMYLHQTRLAIRQLLVYQG